MRPIKILCLILLPLTLVSGCKNADIQQVLDIVQQHQQQPLNNKTVVAGLKEALQVATRSSVSKSSKKGGFSDNPLIKIKLPHEFNKVSSALKKFGLESHLQHFEEQMNRAAETASTEAKAIFIKSISEMTLADGWKILKGENNAATEYFRRTTESKLSTKFKPVIKQSMQKIGFYGDYQRLLKTYQLLPFAKKPNLNIEDYVLKKTLDGLFVLVAQEEQKIRNNPTARVTELLRRVFANQ